jgi:hypothetical protein
VYFSYDTLQLCFLLLLTPLTFPFYHTYLPGLTTFTTIYRCS